MWGAILEKNNNFSAQKIFFWCSIILFLSTWNTFSCNINTLLSATDYFLCNVKLFVSTQNYFSCNTKFLFRASFRMLCNKNIVTCQKIIKFHFYVTQKKLISFFVHHNFLIFSFSITHCQHVDLHRSGPGKKETFNPSFTHLSDIPKQLLSKSYSRKI